jgi:hypothetical protein
MKPRTFLLTVGSLLALFLWIGIVIGGGFRQIPSVGIVEQRIVYVGPMAQLSDTARFLLGGDRVERQIGVLELTRVDTTPYSFLNLTPGDMFITASYKRRVLRTDTLECYK